MSEKVASSEPGRRHPQVRTGLIAGLAVVSTVAAGCSAAHKGNPESPSSSRAATPTSSYPVATPSKSSPDLLTVSVACSTLKIRKLEAVTDPKTGQKKLFYDLLFKKSQELPKKGRTAVVLAVLHDTNPIADYTIGYFDTETAQYHARDYNDDTMGRVATVEVNLISSTGGKLPTPDQILDMANNPHDPSKIFTALDSCPQLQAANN